jgi:autophagy-related protein 2
MPEVGPAPDMINDDLPTNLEYLDESFGAAAGLRELSDDDLEEFDVEEAGLSRATSAAGNSVSGIISRVGGETIKMLRSEGIHILDDFFDTLPLDTTGETTTYVTSTLPTLRRGLLTDRPDWAGQLFVCILIVVISHYSFTTDMTGRKPGRRLQKKLRRCAVV